MVGRMPILLDALRVGRGRERWSSA